MILDYTSTQTNKQPATLQAHTRCVYIFLVTPRRSVTSKLIYPLAMRHDTKLFISLFLSVSPSLSLSLSTPVKPNQVCIKLNNALAWNWCLQSKSTPQPVLQEKAIMYPSQPLHPPALTALMYSVCVCVCARLIFCLRCSRQHLLILEPSLLMVNLVPLCDSCVCPSL